MIDIELLPENVISNIWQNISNDSNLTITPCLLELTAKYSSSLLFSSKFKTDCLIKCIYNNTPIEIFKKIASIDTNANTNANTNSSFMHPMHLPNLTKVLKEACCNNSFEIVKLLLEDNSLHRALPDDDESYCLRISVLLGYTEIVKLLLEDNRPHRVNPNEMDNYSLKVACIYGHTEIVKMLLEDNRPNRALPDTIDNNSLLQIAQSGNIECIKLLLEDKRPHCATSNILKTSLELSQGIMRIFS